jgi:hypothetical protein
MRRRHSAPGSERKGRSLQLFPVHLRRRIKSVAATALSTTPTRALLQRFRLIEVKGILYAATLESNRSVFGMDAAGAEKLFHRRDSQSARAVAHKALRGLVWLLARMCCAVKGQFRPH